MTLLEAVRELLVGDALGWTEYRDPDKETVTRTFFHPKTKTTIVLFRSGAIVIGHRPLGFFDRIRLRRALDERIARIITDHLVEDATALLEESK